MLTWALACQQRAARSLSLPPYDLLKPYSLLTGSLACPALPRDEVRADPTVLDVLVRGCAQ